MQGEGIIHRLFQVPNRKPKFMPNLKHASNLFEASSNQIFKYLHVYAFIFTVIMQHVHCMV